jgi:phosphoesterase RecJ-like protein
LNNKLYRLIESANNIAIFSHVTPDADALCSAFALKNVISNNFDFKNVDVFIDGEIGELYAPIMRDEVVNPEPLNSYDIAFVLDCPNLQRIGTHTDIAEKASTIVNIDHHETNSRFGHINYVSNSVSSTCEMIYLIAKGQNFELNNQIAKELYQGIITDTNCLTSINLTPRTQQVVSELTQYKFDANMIEAHYFKNNSAIKSSLFRKAIQSMRFYNNGMLASMHIPNNMITKLGATFEDTLGIIDRIMNLISSDVGILIIEKAPNYTHCSMRSKNLLNVGEIATIFDGGGSEKQAAFQTYGKINEIEKHLVDTILSRLPESPVDETTDDFENYND